MLSRRSVISLILLTVSLAGCRKHRCFHPDEKNDYDVTDYLGFALRVTAKISRGLEIMMGVRQLDAALESAEEERKYNDDNVEVSSRHVLIHMLHYLKQHLVKIIGKNRLDVEITLTTGARRKWEKIILKSRKNVLFGDLLAKCTR